MDTSAARKARGAFFTPPELCTYVAEWEVREGSDRVFEPSCGDAEFCWQRGSGWVLSGALLLPSKAWSSTDSQPLTLVAAWEPRACRRVG